MNLLSAEDGSPTGEPLPGISDGSDSVNKGSTCNPLPASVVMTTTTSPAVANTTKSNFAPAVKQSKFVTANMSDPEYAVRYAQVVADAMTMTKGQLQTRYKSEYNCHRSRKQGAKARHIKFADSLKDIRDWLIHLGPIPAKGWTVDRIRNSKGYQPNNLRWATKIQQTQNRSVTKWHQLPDGTRLTTDHLAKRLGLKYNALYKRLKNGWTIERLLQEEIPRGLESWRFPPALAQHCEPLYRQRKIHKLHKIEWFIDYFYEVVYEKLDKIEPKPWNAKSEAFKYFEQAQRDRNEILRLQEEREEQSLQQLLIILDPPALSTLGQAPHIKTVEDQEQFITEYSARL